MFRILAPINIRSIIATYLLDRSRRWCAAQDRNLVYIRKTLQLLTKIGLQVEAYDQFRQCPLLRFRKDLSLKTESKKRKFYLQMIIIFRVWARRIRTSTYGFRAKDCTHSMRPRMAALSEWERNRAVNCSLFQPTEKRYAVQPLTMNHGRQS